MRRSARTLTTQPSSGVPIPGSGRGCVPYRITNRVPLRRQRGAVAITVGLALAILIGFLGLVVDLGHMYVAKAEMQNAMDACALAAAKELTDPVSSLKLQWAENAGVTVTSFNNSNFQSQSVTAIPSDITFASSIDGPYLIRAAIAASSAQSIKFVKCEKAQTGIGIYFMKVLGIGTQSVPAHAVATLMPSQSACALPVALCSSKLTGASVGDWLDAKASPGKSGSDGPLTGDFRWANFLDNENGAKALKDVLTKNGACNLPAIGTQIGEPGNVQGARDAWNTRFGLYSGSYKPSDIQPDLTGFTYVYTSTWNKSRNGISGCCAFDDFSSKAQPNNLPYQGDAATGLHTSNNPADSSTLATYGSAHRRVASVPVVDCSQFDSGHLAAIQSWACTLMLDPVDKNTGSMHLEFLGSMAGGGKTACASSGLPGGPGSSGPPVTGLVR